MTANTAPIFTLTPNIGRGALSLANTARDGTGSNIVTVFTAGANGSRISKIVVKATGTTTAGMIRIFIHDGAAFWLWKEISVAAITPSATVQSFVQVLAEFPNDPTGSNVADELPLSLPTGYTLRFTTHNAETFNAEVFGGDF